MAMSGDPMCKEPPAVERLTAVLVYDSRMQRSLHGMRDAASGSIQYVFQAGGASIDLVCDPEDRDWWITGQAVVLDSTLPGAIAGWKVAASAPATLPSAETDDLGMFVLPSVPPGEYEILLTDGQHEIALPKVQVGPVR
jgi:hypothetical protein